MATTQTDRFTATPASTATQRLSGTPAQSVLDRFLSLVLLSGDMQDDGDDGILLSGDAQSNGDLVLLSGDEAASGIASTATQRMTGTASLDRTDRMGAFAGFLLIEEDEGALLIEDGSLLALEDGLAVFGTPTDRLP